MSAPLQSLINTGTKLWLDSIDPALVEISKPQGATGATSNPVIVAGIIKTGRFDERKGKNRIIFTANRRPASTARMFRKKGNTIDASIFLTSRKPASCEKTVPAAGISAERR